MSPHSPYSSTRIDGPNPDCFQPECRTFKTVFNSLALHSLIVLLLALLVGRFCFAQHDPAEEEEEEAYPPRPIGICTRCDDDWPCPLTLTLSCTHWEPKTVFAPQPGPTPSVTRSRSSIDNLSRAIHAYINPVMTLVPTHTLMLSSIVSLRR